VPDNQQLLRSALYPLHVAAAAKMGGQAGWTMPLSFGDAPGEASATRLRAGVFDVSHFGRIRIRGDGALDLLERVCTADVAGQEDNTARWTALCNDDGGIIDLCRLIRLQPFWVLVTSPVCRRKVLDHLLAPAGELGAKVDDQTTVTAMLAVVGPAAEDILSAVLPFSIAGLKPDDVKFGSLMIARYIAERFDFDGQWGLRVTITNALAGKAWRFITSAAGDRRIAPAGLTAWDVLRVEAGLCRYGHEIDETVDPYTCGLAGVVDSREGFIGSDALAAIRRRGPGRRLIGLRIDPSADRSASIPPQGAAVFTADGAEVGTVTSGTYSPTLAGPVAIALVAAAVTTQGQDMLVALGPTRCRARAVELPLLAGN